MEKPKMNTMQGNAEEYPDYAKELEPEEMTIERDEAALCEPRVGTLGLYPIHSASVEFPADPKLLLALTRIERAILMLAKVNEQSHVAYAIANGIKYTDGDVLVSKELAETHRIIEKLRDEIAEQN